MSPTNARAWIKEVFANVVERMGVVDAAYEKYFSKDYEQVVDGKTMTYSQFVSHMRAQKAVMKSVKVTFKDIVVEGDKIATIHFVDGMKKDGTEIKAQVNALFQLRDGKLIRCDELTRLIKGSAEDRDLGSRT